MPRRRGAPWGAANNRNATFSAQTQTGRESNPSKRRTPRTRGRAKRRKAASPGRVEKDDDTKGESAMYRDHRNTTLRLDERILTHVDRDTLRAIEEYAREMGSNVHDAAGLILTDAMTAIVERRRRQQQNRRPI